MASQHTVDDLLRFYTKECLPNKAPRTQYQQRLLCRRFSEDLGRFDLQDLTPLLRRSWAKHLSEEERPRLLAACKASRNPWLYALVSLALMTGCRRGELFSFRWQDVDLERGYFRLAETKNRVRHPVPIPSAGVENLRAMQDG
jgi:integrase